MPSLADPDDRGRRLDELFAAYGLTTDENDRMQIHLIDDFDRMVQHAADVCRTDTSALRFAACVMHVWAETFEGLADFQDQRDACRTLRGGGVETIESFLKSCRPEGDRDDHGDECPD